jgi:xanthosine utilization system XapX-like protein
MMEFTTRDWQIFGGGLGIVIVASILAHRMQAPIQVEMILDTIVTLLGVSVGYFAYKTSKTYGGGVARYVSIMALGVVYYSLTLMPHVMTHIGMLSVPVPKMAFFYWMHITTIWAFILVAYGFYLFWDGGGS